MPIASWTAQDNLARILTWQESRLLTKNLTLQFQKVVYQVQTQRPSYAMQHALVTVCLDAQGKVTLLYKGKNLEYTIFHMQAKQAEIVQTKHLDQALLNQSKADKPAANHPWRKGFATPLSQSRDVPPRGHLYFGIMGTFLLWVDKAFAFS